METQLTMQPHDIGWGKYDKYEGPFTRGTVPFAMPENPSDWDRILAVATATEGGRWNAVNMYDSCILTVGLIQWCEGGQFSVSDMLGKVWFRDPELLKPMQECLYLSSAMFNQTTVGGKFRFIDRRSMNWIDTREEQRQLFLLRSNGRKGTWDDESKLHAKRWAAAMVNIFSHPDAIDVQRKFTVDRKLRFVHQSVREVFHGAPDTEVGHAFKAAYLSFAGNNPTWARNSMVRAMEEVKAPMYSLDWLVQVLAYLTFDPGIAIYPTRYNAIRKPLEKYYGVDLPDVAYLLPGVALRRADTPDVEDVQTALILLGLDLGPKGADGVFGPKTEAAVSTFQSVVGLEPTGDVDAKTYDALRAVLDAVPPKATPDECAKPQVRALLYAAAIHSVG